MGRRSDAREKLLATALELMWSSSYGSVSVDLICERAGVKKGSFYHFFPSKTDLTLAALEANWQEKRPIFDTVFSPQTPPIQRLWQWCELGYQVQLEQFKKIGHVCGCPFASVGSEMGAQDERIRSKIEEMMDRTLKYLESVVRDAAAAGLIQVVDVQARARLLHSYVLGVMLTSKIKNDPEVLRDALPGLFELLGAPLPTSPSAKPTRKPARTARLK